MADQIPGQIITTINNLNEKQLHSLHQIIVQRIKLMHNASAMYAMKDFNILDRVYFNHNGKRIEGIITRLNQKTITVTTAEGGGWKVSPGLLTKIEEAQVKEMRQALKQAKDLST